MRKLISCLVAAAAIGFIGTSVASAATTLDQVKQRGVLNCGSNPGLAGFGLADDKGVWKGFDVDFCRAVAAVIFNDTTKIKYFPLLAKDRYTVLSAGGIDVLARNSTWTQANEAQRGLLFTGTNYYDGQGFMVHKKLNISSALELNGASICVQQGTTTELNLADYFRANNMKYENVSFASADETIKAYDAGRCDAFTTDASGLYAERITLSSPDDNVVLPEIISKEPLSPVVRVGDDQWFTLMRWVNYAMIDAEELGVTQANVDQMLKSTNPAIQRLLGASDDFGKDMGVSKDWAYRIIKLVGNYGEVFDRNLGDQSPLKIKRGLNALWNKGGLQYAPPIL